MKQPKALPLSGLKLINDQAIGEVESRQDGLGFESYATILANAAIGTPGPFTIGIFGDWGMGKTSLMRLIAQRVKREDVLTIWFNAWQYEQEDKPIIPLIGTIIQEIERNKSFRSKLSDDGKNFLRALRAIVYGMSASMEVEVPGIAKFEAGIIAKDMIDREEKLTPDPLIDRSLYYNAFKSLSEAPLPKNVRVIVIIDDLDRCFPDKAIRLLECIKLVLAQRGFIFIIGVARTVVEGYLQHRYEKEYGLNRFEGNSYLDKIVQLAFPIPPHTGRMNELAVKLIKDVDESQRNQLMGVVPSLAEHFGSNPRSLVRFINNLIIDVEVSKIALNENVPLEFFAITRCLQLRWREFFDSTVLFNKGAIFAAESDDKTISEIALNETSPFFDIAKQMNCDQHLKDLVRSSSGKKWLLEHEKRTRAVQFLQDTHRNSEQLLLPKEKSVVTFICSEDEIFKKKFVYEMRKIESIYTLKHRTYPGFSDVHELISQIVRREALNQTIVIIYIGKEEDAIKFFSEVMKKHIKFIQIIIDEPIIGIDVEEKTKSIFEYIYGSASG